MKCQWCNTKRWYNYRKYAALGSVSTSFAISSTLASKWNQCYYQFETVVDLWRNNVKNYWIQERKWHQVSRDCQQSPVHSQWTSFPSAKITWKTYNANISQSNLGSGCMTTMEALAWYSQSTMRHRVMRRSMVHTHHIHDLCVNSVRSFHRQIFVLQTAFQDYESVQQWLSLLL